jgi:hypothetical protein
MAIRFRKMQAKKYDSRPMPLGAHSPSSLAICRPSLATESLRKGNEGRTLTLQIGLSTRSQKPSVG